MNNMNSNGWDLSPARYENWIYTPEFLTEEQCDLVIKDCKKLDSKQGKVGNEVEASPEHRKSKVSFISTDNKNFNWLFNTVSQCLTQANNQFFQFNIEKIQTLQFTEYDATVNGFYTKHLDIGETSNEHRKLSFSVQLTDPNEYEGGDLLLHFSDEPTTVHREKGTMIVFPSYLLHEVTPVTKGVRHSLVGWITGPRFR